MLAPAAAVAVLAAGGYGLSRIGGSPAGSAASGTAATAAAQPRSGALTATGSENRPNAIPAIEAPASFQVVSSRTDYRRATLRQQVEHEVQLNVQGAAGPREPASESVKGCVHRVTKGASPGTLVLAETAYFQGQRAILVVAVSGDQRRGLGDHLRLLGEQRRRARRDGPRREHLRPRIGSLECYSDEGG